MNSLVPKTNGFVRGDKEEFTERGLGGRRGEGDGREAGRGEVVEGGRERGGEGGSNHGQLLDWSRAFLHTW